MSRGQKEVIYILTRIVVLTTDLNRAEDASLVVECTLNFEFYIIMLWRIDCACAIVDIERNIARCIIIVKAHAHRTCKPVCPATPSCLTGLHRCGGGGGAGDLILVSIKKKKRFFFFSISSQCQ